MNTTQKRAELEKLLIQVEAEYNNKAARNWELITALCDRADPITAALKDREAAQLIALRRAEWLGVNHKYSPALELARTSIEYYSEGNQALLLDAVQSAGNSAWNLGDYVAALEYFEQALRLGKELGLEHDISMSLTNLGAAHSRLGNYEQALECYEESLVIKNKLNDIKGVAIILGNIGNVHQYQQNYDAATEYYQHSISTAYDINDTAHIARILNNLGAMQYVKKEYTPALDYFLQALHLLREISENDTHPSIPTLLGHIGEVCHYLEQFDVAAGYMSQALEIVNKQGNQSRLHVILAALSVLYSNEKYREYSLLKAKEYSQQALQIAQDINERTFYSQYTHALAKLEFRLGNYADAYTLLQHSIDLDADLHSKEFEEKLRFMQVQHNVVQLKKEAEIERLKNAVLEVSNKHLEELNAIKNNFLGIAAHDLKNPLSSIKMLARLLEDYAASMTMVEIENIAKDIGTLGSQMFDLIVSLLDINALEQGKINLTVEETELSNIVQRVGDSYISRAEEKGISLAFELEECIALVDTTKFIQITENLISNAIKYSPHNTSVFVRIHNFSPDFVRLSVEDQGQGIAPDDMEKLFAKFQQLKARPTGGEHSTGLGLSIVKQLAELMNGRVWCESVYGEGATFIAEFPTSVLIEKNSYLPA